MVLPTLSMNFKKDQLCGGAKFGFDAGNVYFFGLFCSCKESQKEWIVRKSECIDYIRHPKTLEQLFSIDSDKYKVFNFQRALCIEAINNETKVLDRKAHMF